MPHDEVNNPAHYTQGGVECIDAIRASMKPSGFIDFCKGNVVKYLFRWEYKGGLQDLLKARVYLNWMIDTVEEQANGNGRQAEGV